MKLEGWDDVEGMTWSCELWLSCGVWHEYVVLRYDYHWWMVYTWDVGSILEMLIQVKFDGLYCLWRKLTQYPVTRPRFSAVLVWLCICIWFWMYSFPDQIASLLLSRGTGGLTDEEVGEKDLYPCPGSRHEQQLMLGRVTNRRNDNDGQFYQC